MKTKKRRDLAHGFENGAPRLEESSARASQLVDRLIIGIGVNSEKTGLFRPEERLELVRRVTRDLQ